MQDRVLLKEKKANTKHHLARAYYQGCPQCPKLQGISEKDRKKENKHKPSSCRSCFRGFEFVLEFPSRLWQDILSEEIHRASIKSKGRRMQTTITYCRHWSFSILAVESPVMKVSRHVLAATYCEGVWAYDVPEHRNLACSLLRLSLPC